MTADTLARLGTDIDEAFFLIGIAMLLVELAKGAITGSLRWRGVADMLASASTQIPFLLVQIAVLTAAYAVYTVLADAVAAWSLPITVWTAVLAILLADFLYYWEHRFAHEVRVLWLNHAVHHSSRHMNIVTGVRFGPFEGVWSVIALSPMVLIGFPPELVIFGSLDVNMGEVDR